MFCHSFDLTKRLALPSPTAVGYIPLQSSATSPSPFPAVLARLEKELAAAPDSVHRIIMPSILSPALYPPEVCHPTIILQFLQSLQMLLRQNSGRASCMISIPTVLFPRRTGLTRWLELLADGVIELVPFPHEVDLGPSLSTSGAATAQEEKPQGVLKVHRLPIVHERGSNLGAGDDLAFTVSRKRFQIKPFSLPPMDGDTDAQSGSVDASSKADLEF